MTRHPHGCATNNKFPSLPAGLRLSIYSEIDLQSYGDQYGISKLVTDSRYNEYSIIRTLIRWPLYIRIIQKVVKLITLSNVTCNFSET